MTNIIFFGSPDFVVPVAESILNTKNSKLVAVVTNPDRPVGRKQIITPTPIKSWATEHKIPVLTPEILDPKFINSQIRKFDLGILAAYGKIIPQSIIDLFPLGILVIHPSMLPKYRGASPIQTAIMNGEKETGVSIIKMDAKMDHGPIIYQSKSMTKITDLDTTGDLTRKLFQEAADVLPEVIDGWVSGKIIPQEQNHSKATFTRLLTKEDGFIPSEELKEAVARDPSRLGGQAEAEQINGKIRAMSPWPNVWTTSQQKRLKILKAHVGNEKLVIDLVQFEGKKPQPAPSDLF